MHYRILNPKLLSVIYKVKKVDNVQSKYFLIKRKILKIVKRIVDYFFLELYGNKKIEEKIYKFLDLPTDTEFNNLGWYYKKQYRKLRYIFSRKKKKFKNKPVPQYSANFNEKLSWKIKKIDLMVKFFSSIKND